MKKKRLLSGFLSLCMVASMVPTAALATSDFSDMPSDYSTEAVQNAVKNGLLGGSDGKILPNENLTRAQMAAILVRAFGAEKTANLTAFADVSTSAWYYKELSSAVHMGIFKGEGSTMRPNAPITRQEAFVVLARAFNLESGNVSNLAQFADASSIAAWAKDGVAAMVATGFVKGDGNSLKPLDNISRKDFAVTMDRMVETYIQESGTVTTLADGSVVINKPNVTLKGVTVKGNLIIGDGVGEGDVTLDKVTVTGSTLIRGGGTHSIYAKNGSDLGAVVIAKVDGGLSLKLSENSKADSIEVASDNVTLTGVPKGTQVTVDAGATGAKVNGKAANAGETVTAQPETPSGGGGGGGSSGGGNTTPSVALAVASGKDANLILTSTDDNTVQLTATPSNLGSGVSYAYASDQTSVATVDASTGLVEAKADGTATITVTATYDTNKTVKASVGITVIDNTTISDANELALVFASNATTGTLDAAITGAATITRANAAAFTLTMGTYKIDTLTVNATGAGTIQLDGTITDGNQIETLTVNAPNATFNNNVKTGTADIKAVSNNSYTPTKAHASGITMRKGNLALAGNASTVLSGDAKVTVAPAKPADAVKLTATAEIPAVEVKAAGVLTVDAPVEDLAVQAPAQVEITKDVTTATVNAAATLELTAGNTQTITVTGSDATVAINGATITNEIAVEATGAKLEAVSGTIANITKTDVATGLTIETVSGATITKNETNVTPVEKVKVTLNTNDGQCDKSYLLVTSGTAVGTLPTATKLGYTFDGWFTAASDGTKITAETTVSAGTEYHAQWRANSYTIAFDANGGTGEMTSLAFTYGSAQSLPINVFERDGYTFAGWNTKADGTGTSYDAGASVSNLATSGTVTLYAKWTANTYDVAFNANGGTGTMNSLTLTYDLMQNLTANSFTRNGYTFAGWATSADGAVVYTDQQSVKNLATTGEVTLYAKWKAESTLTVSTAEQLKTALADTVPEIHISGTIGSANDYTTYTVNRAVTLNGGTVYGSFVVTKDGATFDGVTIYNKGDTANQNTEVRNGINAACKTLTVKNCTFNMTSSATGIANGLSIWPTDINVAYTITGNTFNGYATEDAGYTSSALIIAGGISKSFDGQNGTPSKLASLTEEQDLAIINGNTFTNCKNDYERDDWTGSYQIYCRSNSSSDNFDLEYAASTANFYITGNVTRTENATLKSGSTLTVMEGKTLTIASGKTLTVSEGATLTIEEGATLTNNGTLVNNGTIVVNDEAALKTAVAAGGTVKLGKDITLTSALAVSTAITIDGNNNKLSGHSVQLTMPATGDITLKNCVLDKNMVADATQGTGKLSITGNTFALDSEDDYGSDTVENKGTNRYIVQFKTGENAFEIDFSGNTVNDTVVKAPAKTVAFLMNSVGDDNFAPDDSTFTFSNNTVNLQALHLIYNIKAANFSVTGNTFTGSTEKVAENENAPTALTAYNGGQHGTTTVTGNSFTNYGYGVKVTQYDGTPAVDLSSNTFTNAPKFNCYYVLALNGLKEALKTEHTFDALRILGSGGTFNLTENITIPSGKTVEIPAGKTLTIASVVTLAGTDGTSKLVVKGTANMTTTGGTSEAALAAGTYTWTNNTWTEDTSATKD